MTSARPLLRSAAPAPTLACLTEPLPPFTPPASPAWHPPEPPATAPRDPLADTPYRFVQALRARGAMGELVEAEHTALRRRVVVKLLGAGLDASDELADRMRLEAQAVAAISHPNVVTILDVGKTPAGRTYLVMEKLVGRTLGDELGARGFLPVAEAVGLMGQLLDGLDAAHRAGLVHRDIKPPNLFLCDAPQGARVLKILDFGIAKVVRAQPGGPEPLAHPTAPLSMVGTPRWMAPEQILFEPVGPWTDLYAAGLVLYTLVTGRDPFSHHRDPWSALQAHVDETPPCPSAGAPQTIPAAVERAIMKALAKRPADRFASAGAFGDALRRALAAPGATEACTVGGGTAIQPGAGPRFASGAPTYAGRRAVTPPRTRPAWHLARSRFLYPMPWRAAGAAFVVSAVVGTLLGLALLGGGRHRGRHGLSSASPSTAAPALLPPAVPSATAASSAEATAATATPNPMGSAATLPVVASTRPIAAKRIPYRVQAPTRVPIVASVVGPEPPPAPAQPPESRRPFGVEE